MPPEKDLSRRERQIINILHELGSCSARQVMDKLPDSPSYSTVRALLKRMLDKGDITIRQEGKRYIYSSKESREKAGSSAINKLLNTFFDGSAAQAVNALLGANSNDLSPEELEDIDKALQAAKQRKREQ